MLIIRRVVQPGSRETSHAPYSPGSGVRPTRMAPSVRIAASCQRTREAMLDAVSDADDESLVETLADAESVDEEEAESVLAAEEESVETLLEAELVTDESEDVAVEDADALSVVEDDALSVVEDDADDVVEDEILVELAGTSDVVGASAPMASPRPSPRLAMVSPRF